MKTDHKLTIDSVVERDPDVFAAVAGNDIVMVRIESGSYYGLSDVAREIWDATKRPIRISEVVTSLSAAYDVDLATCEKETLSFLENLIGEHLLRISDEPAD